MKVFISFNSHDVALVRTIAQVLRSLGHDVWDGSELFPGDNWALQTGKALEDAEAVVVLLTSNGFNPWQTNEIGFALSNRKFSGRVIPVVVGDMFQTQLPASLKYLQSIPMAEGDSVVEISNRIDKAIRNGLPVMKAA